jgi:hypothetical protein
MVKPSKRGYRAHPATGVMSIEVEQKTCLEKLQSICDCAQRFRKIEPPPRFSSHFCETAISSARI